MPKQTSSTRYHPKKETSEQDLSHSDSEARQPQPPSSRKRLKKLAEVNPNEQIIGEEHTERLDSEDEEEVGDNEYRQFGLQDDEDMKREKQMNSKDNRSKSLKGNQNLSKFLQKHTNQQKKSTTKQNKATKPAKLQLTLEEMARIKKQKRMRRKSSDEFNFSEEQPCQEAEQKEDPALKQYKDFNGSSADEKKLVEYAMKLSLTATSKQPKVEDYPIGEDQVNKKLKFSQKKEGKDSKGEDKKKKVKSKESSQRSGPLAGMVIAFTGEFDNYEKDEVIEVCMQLGAQCPKSLTKKSNLLIQGSFVMDHFKRKLPTPVSETTKSREARQRHIQIVSSEELEDFFLSKTQQSLDELISSNKVGPRKHTGQIGVINRLPPIKTEEQAQARVAQEQTAMVAEKPKDEVELKDNRLWIEKYKPTCLQDIKGHNSQVRQLRQWLSTWEEVHIRGANPELKQLKGPSPKAALLSGDPGIGKTTTARLLAVELNFNVSEFNASDIRNKRGVNLMENSSYSLDIAKNIQRPLIIMDEVDGMSSGDRGGIAAIIQMIKTTKVPIICICNDRSSEKIRSLASHCLDVRFHKTPKNIIARSLKQILEEEGGSGEDRALELLAETFNNDMRQILSYLELIFKTVSPKITLNALSSRASHSKDSTVMINHFDAARRLLNRSEFGGLSIAQRTDLFFVNNDLVPIMVHQNLLASCRKPKMGRQQFHSLVQGLEGIVLGDMLDRTIRREQEWGLMPSYGFMSCVYSTEKISDAIGFPQFPSWLGKNSSERKNRRLTRQLKNILYPTTFCCSFSAIRNQYSSLVLGILADLLKQENLEQAIEFMEEYGLTPAVLNDHLASLVTGSDQNTLSSVPSAIKGRLTRLFNKRHEDAKLREQKCKRGGPQHVKFNQILQQMEVEEDEEGEAQGEESKEIRKKAETAKSRGKKK